MRKRILLSLVFAVLPRMVFGSLDLDTVTRAAESANHTLGAAKAQERAAASQISASEGNFLPHIEANAIDTSGFPGSSGALGITGVAGSPYRSGPAAGLLASAIIWDFGRTLNSVRSAEHLSLAQKAQTDLTRQDVDVSAAQLFYECVRFRSQRDAWSFMNLEAAVIAKEVERFVRTGQRSIVERYLSRAQLEESLTNMQDYQESMHGAEERLRIFTRLAIQQLDCPALEQLSLDSASSAKTVTDGNPLLTRADENARAAEAQVNAAKDDFLPVVKGFAAVGAMEHSRLVPKQDYAVGVGVQLPLFDGFKTRNQVKAAQAQLESREELIEASRDQIDLTNAKYDQLIGTTQTRLTHLERELSLAQEGFRVAKKRYFSLQGNLVDLREALRNLMRTKSEAIDARLDLTLAKTEKEIFNR